MKVLRSIFLLLPLLLITGSLFAQRPDCSNFRNGTFTMKYADLGTATIIRTWNVQREKMESRKIDMIFTVKWTSDCSYTLTPTKATLDNYPNIPKNAVATVRITKTTKNSYTQVTTTNYNKKETAGIVTRVN